jgi:hypothetical protein
MKEANLDTLLPKFSILDVLILKAENCQINALLWLEN